MASIGKIVNQIIEQLSESVSHLTLLVIKNMELNSPLPENLPAGVLNVAKACGALVQIANEIATRDYAEYPRIKKKMLKASADLEEATGTVQGSVKTLQDGDLEKGWRQLADSCKAIAGKTANLLQLVYGAQVGRFFTVSEQALEALELAESKMKNIEKDPQAASDAISAAATHVAQMAEYAKGVAEDAESPAIKEALMAQSAALQKNSDNLIDKVNASLKDPSNPKLKEAVLQEIAATKTNIDSTTKPLKKEIADGQRENFATEEDILQAADDVRADIIKLQELARKLEADPNNEQLRKAMRDLMEKIQDDTRALAVACPDDERIQQLKREVDAYLATMGDILDGNLPWDQLLDSANGLSGVMADMVGRAYLKALKGDGKELSDIYKGMEAFLASKAGQKVSQADMERVLAQLEKMRNAEAREKEKQAKATPKQTQAAVGDSIDDVAKSLEAAAAAQKKRADRGEKVKGVTQNCENVAAKLAELAEAIRNGKGSELLQAAREIAEIVKELNGQIRDVRKQVKDPEISETLLKNTQALKNFSIQMKILASVQAAGGTTTTEDNQLMKLGANLGKVLTSTMSSLESAAIVI